MTGNLYHLRYLFFHDSIEHFFFSAAGGWKDHMKLDANIKQLLRNVINTVNFI